MTSDRPYRSALPVRAALSEIRRCRGTQFDPVVVDAFLAIPRAELDAVREQTAVAQPSELSLVGKTLAAAV
jgi:HD-GYP domain-containing protein (c-di-GMP phosphodiesterase class II)